MQWKPWPIPRKLLKCTCNFPPMPLEPNPCFLPCSHVPPEKAIFMFVFQCLRKRKQPGNPYTLSKISCERNLPGRESPGFRQIRRAELGCRIRSILQACADCELLPLFRFCPVRSADGFPPEAAPRSAASGTGGSIKIQRKRRDEEECKS